MSKHEQEIVQQMLYEESAVFARENGDMGAFLTYKWKSKWQTTLLFRKITTLFHDRCIKMSRIIFRIFGTGGESVSQSQPIPHRWCVWKKDDSLRLCVDFRELNRKTIPDRHPLPRIQDLLDSLGSNSWFSILDQGSAYHQGFVSPESRHLTAFSTPRGLYEWIRLLSGWQMHQLHSRGVWREF